MQTRLMEKKSSLKRARPLSSTESVAQEKQISSVAKILVSLKLPNSDLFFTTSLEEYNKAFEDLKQAGKVGRGQIGVKTYSGPRIPIQLIVDTLNKASPEPTLENSESEPTSITR